MKKINNNNKLGMISDLFHEKKTSFINFSYKKCFS